METLKIVICDDSQEDRDYYEALALELGVKWNIDLKIKTYVNGDDIMFDVEDKKILKVADIIFLDINMPGASGIRVAEKARENGYAGLIIFLTSSVSDYEPAFDVRGFNYITKNEDAPKRFEKVFLQAAKEVKALNTKAITLSGAGKYVQVTFSDIKYFESNRSTITVYYGDESFEFISTLAKLENQLESYGFCRIHRSYLVNLPYVFRLTFERVFLRDGTELPVGRTYYKELKTTFESKGELQTT